MIHAYAHTCAYILRGQTAWGVVCVTPGASEYARTWPKSVSPETDLEWRVWEQAVYLGGDPRKQDCGYMNKERERKERSV